MHFHTLPLTFALFQPGLMLDLPMSWVKDASCNYAALAVLHCYI